MSEQQEEVDPYAQRSYSDYYGTAAASPSASSSASTSSSSSSTASASATPPSSTSGTSSRTSQSRATRSPQSTASISQPQRPTRRTRLPDVYTSLQDEDDELEDELRNLTADEPQRRPTDEEPLFGEGSSFDARTGARGGAGFSSSQANGQASGGSGEQNEDEDTDSYYAILNVQKDASEDEIRDAYRALAVALHPDKHQSPELKSAAENRFQDVQRAYEVLSDAEKRAVYDHFGARGLGRDWAVVRHSSSGGVRSAAEMREEWARLARLRKAEEVENIVRSKSEFIVDVDATRVFSDAPDPRMMQQYVEREVRRIERETGKPITPGQVVEIELPEESFAKRLTNFNLTALKGRHGWETPLTTFTRLSVNGKMVSNGSQGSGNVIGTLRTQWSQKLFTETSLGLFRPHVGSLRAQYELSKYSFVTASASGSTFAVPPQLQLSFVQRLSQTSPLTGFTMFNSGQYTLGLWGSSNALRIKQSPPSATIGLSSRSGPDKGWSCNAGVGFHNQTVAAEYMFRPALLGAPKLRMGITLGTRSGMAVFQSMERKVTDHVKLSVGVQFGFPLGGVTLQLRFNRLGQKLSVPIVLSQTYRTDLVAGCTVLPCVGLLAAEHLYFRPLRRRKVHNRLAALRTQHADLIKQRRQAAREAVDVLRQNARKRAHAERNTGGVVVLRAYYGKRADWPAGPSPDVSPDQLFRAMWGETATAGVQLNGDETSSTATAAALDAGNDDDSRTWCDVTIPVMMLVQRGQLVVRGSRQKHKLMGFYDPCMGESKHLIVYYLFNGRLHSVIVDDVTQLTAPLRAHVIN